MRLSSVPITVEFQSLAELAEIFRDSGSRQRYVNHMTSVFLLKLERRQPAFRSEGVIFAQNAKKQTKSYRAPRNFQVLLL